ncbi:MAG: methyltransferase [Bacilli bacterium]|nr:methyltransferase [Bacilli bacterium]MDD4077176.1 methyltransferase [Bacilli bacterium]MDD4387897.1 methyltransferase [Bacilli bacterium]
MKHYFTNDPDLKSAAWTIEYNYQNHRLTFLSDYGVFSKSRIDYGTHLLLQAFTPPSKSSVRILDIGCGYGIIGLAIAKAYPDFQVELTDINMRAVNLTQHNASVLNLNNVNIYIGNLYENADGLFDVIITNPPIRAGKATVYRIFNQGYNRLFPGGYLWAVVRKQQGAKSLIKKMAELFGIMEIVVVSKGYYVFYVKKAL